MSIGLCQKSSQKVETISDRPFSGEICSRFLTRFSDVRNMERGSSSEDSCEDDDETMWRVFTMSRAFENLKMALNMTKRARKATVFRRPDRECAWSIMLREEAPQLEVPDSFESKRFRTRFRVPYPMFLRLVEWTRTWVEWSPTNPSGLKPFCHFKRPRIATELKVLGVLRMLGRGVCYDDIQELSSISASVMSIFLRTWCRKFTEEIFPEHVFLPKTKEDIAKAMGEYSILGLVGAICSMDVTHVRWDRCPYTLHNLYAGKEGYPTVALEMACTHDLRFISCMDGMYGSLNDKAIVRFDQLSTLLQNQSAFPGVEFEVRTNSTGGRKKLKGPYAIVDGGYHRWRHLMSASRLISDPDFVAWRKRIESARKDIERAFGILKGRCRILKLPMRLKTKEQIDDVVKTCVGLHNMLHDWDDRGKWECGVEWGEQDG